MTQDSDFRYQGGAHVLRTFHDSRAAFASGADTPSAYLERCLATIESREPTVRAWVTLNTDNALRAARESTERYKANRPLSPIDGMPIGIKDVIQTADMPTTLGSPIYEGRHTNMDSASVNALRLAGAVIVGKTVTTEFAFVTPGPTTNPFDPTRTPGGSSSGSAAAVGAGMVPAALGNQVVGSVIRPASYCANYAIKPTLGALHGGEGLSLSQLHLGVHAASFEDMWTVAYEIAQRAGADPGYPGLFGPAQCAAPTMPSRLILLETEGWDERTPGTQDAFDAAVASVKERGVTLLSRSDSPAIERLEQSIAQAVALSRVLCSYEMRWALRSYQATGLLSADLGGWLDLAEQLTLDDYREALQQREQMRTDLAAVAPLADAMLTLSASGPAPSMDAIATTSEPAVQFKTGSPSFTAMTSALGAPAITVPGLSVDGMPLGLQLIGHPHSDWQLLGFARWLRATLAPTTA